MGKRWRGKSKKVLGERDNLLGCCWGVRAFLPAAGISLLHKDCSMLRWKKVTSVKNMIVLTEGDHCPQQANKGVYKQEIIVLIENTLQLSKSGGSRSNLAGLWLPRLGSGNPCPASTLWIWTSINSTCFCSQSFEAAGCFCFRLISKLRKSSHVSWRGPKLKKNTHLFCWCQIVTNCARIPTM